MSISKTFELFGPWLRLAVVQNGCSILVLRNKSVNFYTRNPRYTFKEKTDTTKVRVKDIPLSADDGQIIKALEDHHCQK
jgi:hypothetical protein